ncbi:hypothetical protein LMG9964_03864 [Paraburkholderia phenoliruptrix]|uniref:Uncharacterized protein n=1 Tax=Paraburkholderia phenoliruptrix TaxID=252970 RepID=A0A6J5K7Y4_9BURK|nr:hypothetical protein LMG9964_03864 [Paraburkholderia phenoliruptrix]
MYLALFVVVKGKTVDRVVDNNIALSGYSAQMVDHFPGAEPIFSRQTTIGQEVAECTFACCSTRWHMRELRG